MLRAAKLFLMLLPFCMALLSCEKELSEENGLLPGSGNSNGGSSSGTASFTLEGAPGTCNNHIVSGTYVTGVALSSTNAAVIYANVSVIGTYTISTATINGITFSGSGIFTATGSQQVLLIGSGTPVAAGTFNFKPGTNWCSFPVTVTAGGANTASGTLDCAGVVLGGVYTQGIDLTTTNTLTIPVNVTTAGTYSINSTTSNGASFSGSGTVAVGAQSIVLTGSGTPVNSGAVTFAISFGASTCSVPVTFLPGTPPPTDYFRVKIDGVAKTFNADLDGDITPLLLPNSVAVSGYPVSGSTEYLDITVNSVNPITAGTYMHPFGVSFSTSYYRDANGDGWQPADNSAPAFSVVVTSITATRITGTFSGQYKDLNGTGTNSKIFTEGAFSVPLP